MAKKLTKAQEEEIRRYSEKIKTLSSFVEAVRMNPGYHIGYLGNKGFINMIREVFQNSIDEVMRTYSPCDYISLYYNEIDHTISIFDNGRGIPLNDIERIYTSDYTSSNYDKEGGDFTSGAHGVGAKVTNALSSSFVVESYVLGVAKRVTFIEGFLSSEEEIECKDIQGTRVTFNVSYDVMGSITATALDIRNLIFLLLPLTTIGTTIDYSYTDLKGQLHQERLINELGIIDNLVAKTSTPLMAPVMFSKIAPDLSMKAEIAFTYDSDDISSEDISSFNNFCPTQMGGTHVDGFMDGIGKWFRRYMNTIYLKSNSKLNIGIADIRTGLKVIINTSHIKPIWTSQAKEAVSNPELSTFVSELTIEALDNWSKTNPNDLQKVCKYIKEIAEIRVKSEGDRVKLSKSYTASALTGMPAKFLPATGKEHLEFIIGEGDSAIGAAKLSRCHKRQALLPIRGKIPNALTTDRAKFLSNEEISSIITIIGGGYGKTFDIDKVKYEKFIIMPDADADGDHIATLVLIFVMLYMMPLIIHGRLFKAVPPLFGIKNRNGKYEYFTNKIDFVLYVQKLFSKLNVLLDPTGKQLSNSHISDLLYRNIDYLYCLEEVARKYAIDPKLLEFILMNKDLGFKKTKTLIEDQYRFLNVREEKSTTIIEGLVGNKINTVFLKEQLLNDSKEVLEHIYTINGGNINFNLNNMNVTLFDVMKMFEKSTPSGLIRYKGLGEMNSGQLGESTLHPDSNRTLLQYTVESATAELEAIKAIESNKYDLIANLQISRHDIW